MDPKTIMDLGANGIILFGAVSFFIWLFKFYLPQSRSDFISSLENTIKHFDKMREAEAELHKTVQREEMEAHKQEVLVLKNDLNAIHEQIRAFNNQFGHFITIFISLNAKDASAIINLSEQLRGINLAKEK